MARGRLLSRRRLGPGGMILVLGLLGCSRDGDSPCSFSNPDEAPADAQLAACFAAERPAFGRLRDILAAEPEVTRIERSELRAALAGDGVERLRVRYEHPNEILSLMQATAVETSTRGAQGEIVFSLFARGISTSGRLKSIEWHAKPPAPVVPDTDVNRPAGFYLSYAKLGAGWYIGHSSN
jgi:hypothetical protein